MCPRTGAGVLVRWHCQRPEQPVRSGPFVDLPFTRTRIVNNLHAQRRLRVKYARNTYHGACSAVWTITQDRKPRGILPRGRPASKQRRLNGRQTAGRNRSDDPLKCQGDTVTIHLGFTDGGERAGFPRHRHGDPSGPPIRTIVLKPEEGGTGR